MRIRLPLGQRGGSVPRLALMLALVGAFSPLSAQTLTFAQLSTRTAPPPDHRIAYGPGPLQFGNLRLPRSPGPHPVVLFIHGGCWLSRYDIAHAAALEQALDRKSTRL